MECFKASTHYQDWNGTVSADNADVGNSLEEYLQRKHLIKPKEFLMAVSLNVGENNNGKLGGVSVSVILFNGPENVEAVQKVLDTTKDPIPVRAVDISLTLEEFITMFKNLEVMLTWKGLDIVDRKFDANK